MEAVIIMAVATTIMEATIMEAVIAIQEKRLQILMEFGR
jgi:hypothetical protein